MSKFSVHNYLILAGLILVLEFVTYGQEVEATIVISAKTRSAQVDGRFAADFAPVNPLNFYFRKAVTGNKKLGERISEVVLSGGSGPIAYKQLMPGEFLAGSAYRSWSYKADLSPVKDRSAAAHSSWVSDEQGILFLGDLLPQIDGRGRSIPAKLKITLPEGWKMLSAGEEIGKYTLRITNVERGVIRLGKEIRNIRIFGEAGPIDLNLSGNWLFTDDEAAGMAREIFDEYTRILGPLRNARPWIAITGFPVRENPGSWEAETRGQSVMIVSSDMPFKTQSQQRLHEQLRHEIFHLWFPNGIDLAGDYAWFYEGFALYQSLKIGVKLGRIRFDDFLDTLSRAHSIDEGERPRKPLTGSGAASEIYARALLVAFLIDVDILSATKGMEDSGDLLRRIFKKAGDLSDRVDATKLLRESIGSKTTLDRFVFGNENVDWSAQLEQVGIGSNSDRGTTRLSISQKLTGRQKQILRRLGYNINRNLGNKR